MRKPTIDTLARIAAAIAAAIAWSCVPAQDKGSGAPELKLSMAQSPAFPIGRAGERWAALMNEASGGAHEIKTYPGAVLAGRDPLREFGTLRDGGADLAVGSALMWSAQLPVFAVYALPWLAPDPREQEALAANADVRERVSALAALADVVVVAVAPLGERVLATMKGAVQAPVEMAGLRVRTVAHPLLLETLAALGARPESMSLADAQAAFAAGALDGQEAPASTLAATRIAAMGPRFVSRWGGMADVMVFAVRKSVWSRWSDAQRERARTAAVEAAREAAALAREDVALAELVKQGVTVVKLAPSQRATFRAAVEPVWTKWSSVIGADVVQAAVAAVAPK
jgi:TRAP-type C4-dicarboxylate transport system substrate-binding protein